MPETSTITYRGRKFIALKDAKRKYNLAQPTLYYWATNAKVTMLDLDEVCAETPFRPDDLKHQYYFDELELQEMIQSTKKGVLI